MKLLLRLVPWTLWSLLCWPMGLGCVLLVALGDKGTRLGRRIFGVIDRTDRRIGCALKFYPRTDLETVVHGRIEVVCTFVEGEEDYH